MKKTALYLLPILSLPVLAFLVWPSEKKDDPVIPPAPKPDSIAVVNLAIVGDLMCHMPQATNVKVSADSFNFHQCFAEIKHVLSAADFTIGNLETTMAGVERGFSGYPRFNSPDDYVTAVRDAGFDFLVTGNNHSVDTEGKGVIRTLDVLDAHGMDHTGSYRTLRDRDSIRVADVKGLKIAILNYTYSTNGLPVPADMPWVVNLIDTALMKKDVAAARALPETDLVMVVFHFGTEYSREPDAYQADAVKCVRKAGADLIIGSHPHVLQPVELFATENARIDTGVVAWSLGNFFSNQDERYRDAGAILHVQITKNFTRDSIWLSDLSYTPTWVYRGTNPAKKVHIIYPARRIEQADSLLPKFLRVEETTRWKEAYNDTRKHFIKRLPGLRMDSL